MDKERLEEIKQKFIDSPDDDITWLISTVEEQDTKIEEWARLIKMRTKKMIELNLFLQKRNVNGWGKEIIDVAMDLIEEQQKETQCYKQALDAINLLINQDFWNIDELKNGIKQQIETANEALKER